MVPLKLVRSNGVELTVRDVGPVVFRLRRRKGGAPLPVFEEHLTDDAARAFLRELLDSDRYDRGEPDPGAVPPRVVPASGDATPAQPDSGGDSR